jgi:hypothetical protein
MTITPRKAHIGHVSQGDTVTFNGPDDDSITGIVTTLVFGAYQGDYCHITVNADGMLYEFGTGGHLGDTWTTGNGTDQWFLQR